MEKYIKELSYKIIELKRSVIASLKNWHETLLVKGWYPTLFMEFATIALTGVLISIALIPLTSMWKPWLFFSYGLFPWIVIQLMVYAKREWRNIK